MPDVSSQIIAPQMGWRFPLNHVKVGLFVGVAALAAFFGYQLGYKWLVMPVEAGRLSVDEKYLDFGKVMQQEKFIWRVPFENHSNHAIEVAEIHRSCNCVAVKPSSFSVPPNSTRSIQLELDLTRRKSFLFDAIDREFSVELRPIYDLGMTGNDAFTIHGKVQSPFLLSNGPPQFPSNSLMAGIEFPSLEFKLEPRVLISDFHLDVTKDSAPATVAATQDGDSAIHVRVHPDALLPAGPHEFALRLNAKGVVEGELPEQIIRIPGRVVEDIEVVPPFLRMRKVNVGESDPVHTVKLRSRTAQPFRVVAISASAASVRVSPISTLDEMTDAFACDVSAVGDNHGELSINTVTFDVLALGSRQHAISVPLEIVVSKK